MKQYVAPDNKDFMTYIGLDNKVLICLEIWKLKCMYGQSNV